jgi:hypothetical protein
LRQKNQEIYNSQAPITNSNNLAAISKLQGTSQLFMDRSNSPVATPVITLDINAQWVGVYQPQGKPSITSVPSNCEFTAGGQTYPVQVSVVNNGDDGASIATTFACTGLSPSIPNFPETFSSGQTKVYTNYLTGTEGTQSCTVTAKSSTATAVFQDVKTFICIVKKMCNQNQQLGRNYMIDPSSSTCEAKCALQPIASATIVDKGVALGCDYDFGGQNITSCSGSQLTEKNMPYANASWAEYPNCAWVCYAGYEKSPSQTVRACVPSGGVIPKTNGCFPFFQKEVSGSSGITLPIFGTLFATNDTCQTDYVAVLIFAAFVIGMAYVFNLKGGKKGGVRKK